MTEFTRHTTETAPEESKPLLAKSEAGYGGIAPASRRVSGAA